MSRPDKDLTSTRPVVQNSHMATTPTTDTVHTAHALNRSRKAARIARTAIMAGVTVDMLDNPQLADILVRATPCEATHGPRGGRRTKVRCYTEASDECMAEAKAILFAMTEPR